jgi:hypothetical protein
MKQQDLELADRLRDTIRESMPTAAFASGLTAIDPAALAMNAKAYVAALAIEQLPEELGLSKVRAWLVACGDAQSEAFVRAVRHEMILAHLRLAVANGPEGVIIFPEYRR